MKIEENFNEVRKPAHKKRSLKEILLQGAVVGAITGVGNAFVYGATNDVSYSDQVNVACMLSAFYGTVNFAVAGVGELISRVKDYNRITRN